MKKLFFAIALLFFALINFEPAHAAVKSKKKNPGTQLSTDISFDGRLVRGKYQSSSEAVATVENDKNLDDLIGVRKHFKDRLEKSESLR